ncbi:class I SAM-dependent methyltransferase [Castellaniella ginsengisoli]|uniref:Class I SAM-dependent methyltransferase n=1 Tax=Castellaniella ginsengisoli TaxID=546114 RepID=A0AB39D2H9_9BURK
MDMPILDPACGARMMWFNPQDQRCLFGDMRDERITVTDRTHREDGTRAVHIHPDARMDFRALPFADESFALVAFDPPHLVRAGRRSWMAAKYGKLGADWQDDMRQGFAECFRVLRPHGVLIFKWNETQVPLRDILECTPEQPLFGHRVGRLNRTHWLTFMKGAT